MKGERMYQTSRMFRNYVLASRTQMKVRSHSLAFAGDPESGVWATFHPAQ